MALLMAEAAKLSKESLERGVIEEIYKYDQLYSILPFMGLNDKAYVYNRENTLATAAWTDTTDTVPESASTFTEVTTTLKILIGDVDVPKFLQETYSNPTDQKATQIQLKAKAMAMEFADKLINGDTAVSAKQFDGVAKLVTAGQKITPNANGASLTLEMLDQLKSAIPNGGPDAFIMREGTARAYKTLIRAAGGNTAYMMQLPNFGKPVLTHDGVPILINDNIKGDVDQGSATDTCSIYAVRLNIGDGLHGLYGGDRAGIRVEEIGTVQNMDSTRTRLKWYVGLALKSTKSLAALVGITNV